MSLLSGGDSYMGPWWFWVGAILALFAVPLACVWLFEYGGAEWLVAHGY